MWIYKITNNVNNKFYIGKTTRNVAERFHEHVHYKHIEKMPICRAIAKYGYNNFSIEIIDTATTLENLNIKEQDYIKKLKPEYNATLGGDGGALFLGHKHTDETKQKIRNSRLGKLASDETKKKMRDRKLGIPRTESTIKKMVEKQEKTYYFLNKENKKIQIINLNKFCRENKINSSGMRSLLSGRLKTYKGYRRILP